MHRRSRETPELHPQDGCQSAIFANYDAIINTWDSVNDNNYMFVSYADDHCCHNAMVEQISWDDSVCQPVKTARSYKIVHVAEPDKGKTGEIYTCEVGEELEEPEAPPEEVELGPDGQPLEKTLDGIDIITVPGPEMPQLEGEGEVVVVV